LEYCLELDDSVYVFGDPVNMRYAITNHSPDSLWLTYLYYNIRTQFLVYDSTGAFMWSHPSIILPAGWAEWIGSDATVADIATWDMMSDGNLVDVGTYRVRATSFVYNHPAPDPELEMEFEIVSPLGIDELTEPALWSTLKSLFR
jgi:carbohydrate-selective porin OprB